MAIKDDTLISVRNRDRGTVGYTLDNNFHRDFAPNEIKKVPLSEIKALSYAAGGQVILNNYLVIEDKEVLDLLNMNVEPEYFYSEKDIEELLMNGSIDAFADFLDFAPEGAIDIAKDLAIKNKVPDTRKREMLSKKTGLNINNAIMVNEVMDAGEEKEEEAPKQRRIKTEEKVVKQDEAPVRRTSTPNYKVVTKN